MLESLNMGFRGGPGRIRTTSRATNGANASGESAMWGKPEISGREAGAEPETMQF